MIYVCVCVFRQERFINRWIDALSDPRLTHEIKAIWFSYWSQVIKQGNILTHVHHICIFSEEVCV